MFTGYATDDGEIVCEMCVDDPDADDVRQLQSWDECDTPQHCAYCARPIDHELTWEAVTYIIDAVRRDLKRGRAYRLSLMTHFPPGHYYHGSTHYAFMRDWTDRLRGFRLNRETERILDLFHYWSREPEPCVCMVCGGSHQHLYATGHLYVHAECRAEVGSL